MLWTEKYSPKNFDDVLGNVKVKNEILEWTEEWLNGNPQKCLLLIGPPGTGKTTMAHLAAKEFSEFVELNASDKRSYDIITNTVGESSLSRSLYNEGLKLIILDEVDGIHGTEDRGGTRAIGNIIKTARHPIIMMANDPYSKRLKTLKTKCTVLKLRKVHTNSIVALLKRICVKEHIEFDEYVLRNLAKQSKGDLRSAINDLEAIAKGKDKVTSKDLELISRKDEVANIFDSVRTVLKSKNIHHINDAMKLEAEPNFILELVAENIPREYEKAEEIAKAYEMVSLADTYLGRAFQTRVYSYWKYSYKLMSLGVALSKEETYRKFARYANSSVYSMLSKSRAKRTLRDAVAEKMGEKLHSSKKVVREQFPYFETMFQDDEVACEIAAFFDLDDKEVKLFRSKKIPKKVKTAYAKKLSKTAQEEVEKGLRGAFKTSNDTKAGGSKDEKSKKTEKTVQTKKSSEKEMISNKSPAEERGKKRSAGKSTSKKSKSKEKSDKKVKAGKSDKTGKKDKQTSLFNF
jgi:replication factor C large subunit